MCNCRLGIKNRREEEEKEGYRARGIIPFSLCVCVLCWDVIYISSLSLSLSTISYDEGESLNEHKALLKQGTHYYICLVFVQHLHPLHPRLSR